MQNKKLSIVAGIYFPPEICFRRFLDACLRQTIDDVEFIFLLDHPEDTESRKILEEYKQQFLDSENDFRIIENEKNFGVKRTYQKGCGLANSDTILIVDSDDFFDNDLIEKMFDYFTLKQLDFLAPKILIGYVGELDVFYALNENNDPDDSCIMFKKTILDEYKTFNNRINCLSMSGSIMLSKYKAEIMPLDSCSFYYYTVTNRSATSSFILQERKDITPSKESEVYKKNAKNQVESILSSKMKKKISFEEYTINEMVEMAKDCVDIDNFCDNDFTYDNLKDM